jgi:hypothetical protein
MEVLNALIVEADRKQVLAPLLDSVIKYRAFVYSDDLVIFLHPEPNDFICMQQLLLLFAG